MKRYRVAELQHKRAHLTLECRIKGHRAKTGCEAIFSHRGSVLQERKVGQESTLRLRLEIWDGSIKNLPPLPPEPPVSSPDWVTWNKEFQRRLNAEPVVTLRTRVSMAPLMFHILDSFNEVTLTWNQLTELATLRHPADYAIDAIVNHRLKKARYVLDKSEEDGYQVHFYKDEEATKPLFSFPLAPRDLLKLTDFVE